MDPCPFAAMALPTPEGTLRITGAIALAELGPGEHRLFLAATDHWGHTSLPVAVSFVVSLAALSPGGVVVIGQDYSAEEAERGSGGLVSTTPAEKVLGNAAYLSAATRYDRPLAVSVVDLGSSTPDFDTQVAHLAQGMCRRAREREAEMGASCACDGTGLPCLSLAVAHLALPGAGEGLERALVGADVLLIPDQDGLGPVALEAVGSDPLWQDRLKRFAVLGGVVVVTSGTESSDGAPTSTYQLVSGLVRLTAADPASIESSVAVLECHSRDPVAYAMTGLDDTNGSAFDWPESWILPAGAVRFLDGDRGREGADTNEIFTTEGLDCPSSALGCRWLPSVVHAFHPARPDLGPVHVTANEIVGPAGARALVARGEGDTAIFQSPSGGAVDFCPLHPDGTVSHEVRAGGVVTIARGTPAGEPDHPSWSPRLESLHGVLPGDAVVIGFSSFGEPAADLDADVTLPVWPGAHHYRVSSGCESISVADPGGGATEITFPLAFAERCSTAGLAFVVAAAADANDEVLAFDLASAPFSPGAALDATWRGWIARPWYLAVQPSPAFDPGADPVVAGASVAVALAHRGLLFDEGLPPDESSLPWSPRFPSPLAVPAEGGVRVELRVRFRDDPASGTADVTAFRRTDTPPGADRVVDVPAGDLLARVSAVNTSGTPGIDGVTTWTVDGSLWAGAGPALGLAHADGLVLVQRVELVADAGGASCPPDGIWLHMAAAGPLPGLVLPVVPPGALPCRPGPATAEMVTFFSRSDETRDQIRRAFADSLPDDARVLAFGGLDAVGASLRAAPPGTVERWTSSSTFTSGGGPGSGSGTPPPPPVGQGATTSGAGCGSPGAGPAALLALAALALRRRQRPDQAIPPARRNAAVRGRDMIGARKTVAR